MKVDRLSEYSQNIKVYDPWASAAHVLAEYKVAIVNELPAEQFDVVILAVAHKEFLHIDIQSLLHPNGIVYDVKGVLPRDIVDGRL